MYVDGIIWIGVAWIPVGLEGVFNYVGQNGGEVDECVGTSPWLFP